MYYFKFSPAARPELDTTFLGKSVVILRWAEQASWRTLTYGVLKETQIRKNWSSKNYQVFETHLQVGNAWNELAPGDEVFLYDPTVLTPAERERLVRAFTTMLVGEPGVGGGEVDKAIASILATYRS